MGANGPAAPSLEDSVSNLTLSDAGASATAPPKITGTASGRPVLPRRIKNPISVAPMVDVTTSHFLHLCRLISNNFTLYTEMVHCNAVAYNPEGLINFFGKPWEGKVVQLGGQEPEMMAKAAKLVQDNGYHEVNINVGCPSNRVQKGAFGALLMKNPQSIVDIINEMVNVGVTIPITVKCRIGVDHLDSYEYLYDFLAKDFPHLTFTINGGFKTPDQLKEQLDLVDGVMVGREVMDSPMFLAKVDAALHGIPATQIKSTREIMEEYLDYVLTEHERGTPHSNSMVMAPLKMMIPGRRGKDFRRQYASIIMPRTKPLPDIVRDMRELLKDFNIPTGLRGVSLSDSESASDEESEADEPEKEACSLP
ncbi:hypothetical protein BGZ73_005956 [Actinomortierella ambigua]|nr:hypothetical protein BGZ73_005956 [Actinomortierella ambigua]